MKLLKLTLAVLLVLVTGVWAVISLSEMLSDQDSGPSITCASDTLEVSVMDGSRAMLEGVSAADGQDGDLTAEIEILGVSKLITEDTARVTYIVFDSDDNMATATRMIRYVDYHKPIFALLEPLEYVGTDSIALLDRIQITDVIDGDITNSVRLSALSATETQDIHTVSLQVTNSMGDTAQVTLPVVVRSNAATYPEVVLGKYLLYLQEGAAFDAADYLISVSTADGRGSTDDVQITGTVDTARADTYYVYYRYPNDGMDGLAILTVVVQ